MMSDNGELNLRKAFSNIQDSTMTTSCVDLMEYCKAVVYIESLLNDVVTTLTWMLKQLKWKHREQLGMEDENTYPDSVVNWSPEIRKAMELLEKLRNES